MPGGDKDGGWDKQRETIGRQRETDKQRGGQAEKEVDIDRQRYRGQMHRCRQGRTCRQTDIKGAQAGRTLGWAEKTQGPQR